MNRNNIVSYGALLFCVGCCGRPAASPTPEAPPAPPPAPLTVEAPPEAPPPATSVAQPAAEAPPKAVVEIREGLSTPESVLYDEAQDRYLISNIEGPPAGVDNNGFITEASPDGKITRAKFIAGGVNNVKLDAPKGMGISKGVLYVTDITVVRKFDVKTGAPKGEIPVPGASFLNDIAIAGDGKIYVSDSGLKAGAKDLEPSGTDAVYVIEGNKARAIAKSADLARPNGLALLDKQLIVVTFGGAEAYKLSDKGERTAVTKLPAGTLDGVVALDGELLISSWASSSIYRGKLDGQFAVAIPGVPAPADIGYDSKRKRVLVPHFKDNVVKVFELP